jgi:hypothetical protein
VTVIDDDMLAAWRRDGWLALPELLDPTLVTGLVRWVDEVADWADNEACPGIHHHEQTDHGPALARSEYFADAHDHLGAFVRGLLLGDILAALLGEPAVLFKEKINYKQPGGAGFAPHQDATAYRFVDHHVSVMVPLDPATEASGCLWFAPGHDQGRMPTDHRGRIEESHAATLDWRPVEARPGDIVVFDSYAPHRSDTNTTDRPRRALYLTYNAASLGDHRAEYYLDKLTEFDREGDDFAGERVRISVNDDFLGRPVAR